LHGTLEAIGRAPVNDPPMYVSTDRSGRYLFSASYAGATLTTNAVDADGRIVSPPLYVGHTPPQAHGVVTDRTNRFAFVTALGGDAILQFLFDASTGGVSPNDVPFVRTPSRCGPRHLAFHPRGNVLYVNGELDGSVRSYALDSQTGRLEPLHAASMLPDGHDIAPWAAELAVRADGRFLYASERRTSTLSIFDLSGESGTLRRCGSIVSEDVPRSFALDRSGRFLLVAGEVSNHLTLYRVDSETGRLDVCNRYPAGEKPVWVVFADVSAARSE
jgi:6-phosphogluconolactonase